MNNLKEILFLFWAFVRFPFGLLLIILGEIPYQLRKRKSQ
jgi:hypothetical protein